MSVSGEERELLVSFVVETQEMLEEIEPLLVNLHEHGSAGQDAENINAIFRLFHTIKGTSGFMGLNNLQDVTHHAENLLDAFRKGYHDLTAHDINLLLKVIDFIHKGLNEIEVNSSDSALSEDATRLQELFAQGCDGDCLENESKQAMPKPIPAAAAAIPDEKPIEPAAGKPMTAPENKQPEKPIDAKQKEGIRFKITPEMRNQFIDESHETLDQIEMDLLQLEDGGPDEQVLDSVFRAMHTFKGNCGLLGYEDLQHLAHLSENLLSHMRDGAEVDFVANIRMLLKLVESFAEALTGVAGGGSGGVLGYDGMVLLLEETEQELAASIPQRDTDKPATMDKDLAELSFELPAPPQAEAKPKLKEEPQTDTAKAMRRASSSVSGTSVRIDLEKVDKLVDWAGELAIAELMVVQNPDIRDMEKSNFDRAAFNLHTIITEVQNLALSLRMVPIAKAFQKMPRLVHDLSAKADKSVRLIMQGEDTEVDKSVVDYIGDPLVHIVRNAIDHGIESAERRDATGKDPTGHLVLEARHESGEVWIVVRDDGGGMSRDRILQKAIDNHLITEEEGRLLPDSEIYKFVFEAGFSTAEKVTEISGRGVGMDVVRKNLEKIKGRIEIQSEAGKGTAIFLRIPLTMAVIDGMVVQTGGKSYIVPLLSVREFFQPALADVTMTPAGKEFVKIREELLPVMRLHKIYDIKPKHTDLQDGLLLIIEHDGKSRCLFVDAVIGQQQAVIKAVPSYLEGTRGVSGFTILADGDVCPILDMSTLLQIARQQDLEKNTKDKAPTGVRED